MQSLPSSAGQGLQAVVQRRPWANPKIRRNLQVGQSCLQTLPPPVRPHSLNCPLACLPREPPQARRRYFPLNRFASGLWQVMKIQEARLHETKPPRPARPTSRGLQHNVGASRVAHQEGAASIPLTGFHSGCSRASHMPSREEQPGNITRPQRSKEAGPGQAVEQHRRSARPLPFSQVQGGSNSKQLWPIWNCHCAPHHTVDTSTSRGHNRGHAVLTGRGGFSPWPLPFYPSHRSRRCLRRSKAPSNWAADSATTTTSKRRSQTLSV